MLGPPGSGKSEYIPQHATVDPAAPLQRDILFRRGNPEWAIFIQRVYEVDPLDVPNVVAR